MAETEKAGAGSSSFFHLDYPRVVPARKPEGHVPAAPRYTLRWRKPIGLLVSQYHAIQAQALDTERQRAFFELMLRSFGESDGPSAYETMQFVDEAGEINAVVASYWLDATAHARWTLGSSASRWFADPDRLKGSEGCWRETITAPYDRHETIYSAPNYRVGLARTEAAEIVSMTTNGYFGAARDRLPISAIDTLESPLKNASPLLREVESRGCRLVARTPHNMTALRSGQYWEPAQDEQRTDYIDDMQPRLMRGMDYLSSNKAATGTLSLRIMTNLDHDGQNRAETSVLAYFLSLENLEDWAKSHETHLAIYHHAIAMNRKFKADRQVVTWHEMFVMLAADTFEYVNCHSATGLLPFAETYRLG